MGNQNQRLNGLNPLAYLGDNAYQPSEFYLDFRAPTINDSQNFSLGAQWLDRTTGDVYILVNLNSGRATWILLTGNAGTMTELTGNSGGTVAPNAGGNINLLGDTTTINIVGNPATNTLTVSAIGTGLISTLTGNSGGAVFPTANNTNIVGTGVITVVGNPGTSTLTITPSGAIASSFPTNAGTATPSSGVLNILGGTTARDINTSGSGNTIHIDLNNAITLGDLSAIGAGSNALSATTGDINLASGNIKLTNTNSAGSSGEIQLGGARFISNYGTGNTFLGSSAGNTGLTVVSALFNTGVGFNTCTALTTGTSNTAVGYAGLGTCDTGNYNTAIGFEALNLSTSGSSNTGIGYDALHFLTTGSNNTAIGWESLLNVLTGTNNTALGYNAGNAFTGAEASNICINNTGTIGDSNVLRIGAGAGTGAGQLNKAFIHGIRGITTGVNDAIAVLVDSAGQLGTVSSSIRFKENIEDMDEYSADIYKLRPVIFNYKGGYIEDIRSGLIAEEVEEIMPELVAYDDKRIPTSVKYHDLPTLLLNELQKLNKRVEELESKLSQCCKE